MGWRRFRYSDFGVATEVATVTLLDEQDREGNETFGLWISYTAGGATLADQHGEGVIVDGA